MGRAVTAALLLACLAAAPLAAQDQPPTPATALPASVDAPLPPVLPSAPAPDPAVPAECPPWQPVWGVVGGRAIFAGPKEAPNGVEYHPNFSLDLDFNFWLWRDQHLYLFTDDRFWGERPEYGVTNARDGFMGTSKRQFDLTGGAAWNYAGPWEVRAFGYSFSNLNRGESLVVPAGINDGFGMENRFYLSPEYQNLGQAGFDVEKASFLSIGYYPSKTMTGNDGQEFKPGLMLRAYVTHDLWDWPCYAFGDATLLGDRSFQAKLFLFDVGLAARPFSFCKQCEFRLGVENTADIQARDLFSLWYASIRYLY